MPTYKDPQDFIYDEAVGVQMTVETKLLLVTK